MLRKNTATLHQRSICCIFVDHATVPGGRSWYKHYTGRKVTNKLLLLMLFEMIQRRVWINKLGEWTKKWMNDWMDGWMDGWMNERTNGRTNERMNEKMGLFKGQNWSIASICIKSSYYFYRVSIFSDQFLRKIFRLHYILPVVRVTWR